MAWLTTVKHALPTVPCKNLLILGLSQTLWAHVAVENGSMGLKPAALRRDVRICDPLETRPRPTPYVLPCRIWSLWSNHMGVGKIWESQKFETLGTRRPNCVRWHDRPQRDHFSPPDVLFISCRMWTIDIMNNNRLRHGRPVSGTHTHDVLATNVPTIHCALLGASFA